MLRNRYDIQFDKAHSMVNSSFHKSYIKRNESRLPRFLIADKKPETIIKVVLPEVTQKEKKVKTDRIIYRLIKCRLFCIRLKAMASAKSIGDIITDIMDGEPVDRQKAKWLCSQIEKRMKDLDR